jgi:outer membrane autotransporter protein
MAISNPQSKGRQKIMKSKWLFVSAGIFCLLSQAARLHAQSTLINFDNLPPPAAGGTLINNGYSGLNWNNFYTVDATTTTYRPSGYVNGVVSPNSVAFNGYGNPASFSVTTGAFTLVSGYFTGAWNNGLTIEVTGLSHGQVVDSTSFVVNTSGPTLETFNWSGIDTVELVSSGGTLNPAFSGVGAGEHFALDNLTLNFGPAVPTVPGQVFWTGNVGGSWLTSISGNTNWAANSGGASTSPGPGPTTDVFLSSGAGGANLNMALGQDFTIHSLTINDSGAVTIGAGNTLTISGASGTMGLTVNSGAGLFTMNANLTLAGASNTITVNNAAGAVINGVVGGGIGLVKAGVGTLDLTAVNTYTGDTMVNQGALFVDGSIASTNTTVQSGALIGGHGVIGGNLANSGIVAPGNSPGTLTVSGNYTQSPAGTLFIEVGGLAPGQHDLLSVGGTAQLAGTLQLVRLNNFQFNKGDSVTFLTATQGVSGTFATVSNPFSTGTMIGAQVVYGPNSVALTAVQESFSDLVKMVADGSGGSHLTHNQSSLAFALDESINDRNLTKLFNRLDNESLIAVLNDLVRISPDSLTSSFQTAISETHVQGSNLQHRMTNLASGSTGFDSTQFSINGGASQAFAGPTGDVGTLEGPDGKSGKNMVLAPTPDNRWGAFITGAGEWTDVGDTSSARGYDLTNAGFTLGVDFRATDHLAIGVAAGYDYTSVDLANNGRVTVDGAKLALYGTYFAGGFYVDTAVQGGYNSYDSRRSALEGEARSSMNGGLINVLFGTGYDFKLGAFKIGPTANFGYTYLGLNSAQEHGSLAPLDFPRQHEESITSAFGAKATYDWKIGHIVVRPEVRTQWQHEYGITDYGFAARFDGSGGAGFNVQGPAIGRDSMLLGAGFAIAWSERVSTYVYYDAELFRTNYQSNAVSGGVRIEF